MIIGFLFSQTFSNIDYFNSLWVGLFAFLGADTIYRNLEGKLSSYGDLVPSGDSGNITPSKEKNSLKTDDVVGEIKYE